MVKIKKTSDLSQEQVQNKQVNQLFSKINNPDSSPEEDFMDVLKNISKEKNVSKLKLDRESNLNASTFSLLNLENVSILNNQNKTLLNKRETNTENKTNDNEELKAKSNDQSSHGTSQNNSQNNSLRTNPKTSDSEITNKVKTSSKKEINENISGKNLKELNNIGSDGNNLETNFNTDKQVNEGNIEENPTFNNSAELTNQNSLLKKQDKNSTDFSKKIGIENDLQLSTEATNSENSGQNNTNQELDSNGAKDEKPNIGNVTKINSELSVSNNNEANKNEVSDLKLALYNLIRDSNSVQSQINSLSRREISESTANLTAKNNTLQSIDTSLLKSKDNTSQLKVEKSGSLTRASQTRLLEKIDAVIKEVAKSKDGKSISFKIDPPSLGTVKVNLSLRDSVLKAKITPENNEVFHLLREKSYEIHGMLRGLGLNVDNISLTVTDGSGSLNFSSNENLNPNLFNGGNKQEDQNKNSSSFHNLSNTQEFEDIGIYNKNIPNAQDEDHWVA